MISRVIFISTYFSKPTNRRRENTTISIWFIILINKTCTFNYNYTSNCILDSNELTCIDVWWLSLVRGMFLSKMMKITRTIRELMNKYLNSFLCDHLNLSTRTHYIQMFQWNLIFYMHIDWSKLYNISWTCFYWWNNGHSVFQHWYNFPENQLPPFETITHSRNGANSIRVNSKIVNRFFSKRNRGIWINCKHTFEMDEMYREKKSISIEIPRVISLKWAFIALHLYRIVFMFMWLVKELVPCIFLSGAKWIAD